MENFKYMGSIISNKGFKPEIISRIAQTTSALFKVIQKDKTISITFKVKLMLSFILFFLYDCENLTFTAEFERRLQSI